MGKLDSLESIKKRYKHIININDREGGVLRCWVMDFKDVTMVALWVEFPDCNGELTPTMATKTKLTWINTKKLVTELLNRRCNHGKR